MTPTQTHTARGTSRVVALLSPDPARGCAAPGPGRGVPQWHSGTRSGTRRWQRGHSQVVVAMAQES